jgi:hypothetical protein
MEEKKLKYTDLQKEFFTNYVLKSVKSKLNGNEFTESNIRLIDWYDVLSDVVPQLIFCVVKDRNDQEMSLFSMEDPELQNFGFKYVGDKNINDFWVSFKSTEDFESKDFYCIVYAESLTKKDKKVRLEKDTDGAFIYILRDGTKGKTCLLQEENYDIYDSMISPDSILGDCKRAKRVHNLKDWSLAMMKHFGHL